MFDLSIESISLSVLSSLDRYYLNGNRSIIESSLFYLGQTRVWYKRGTKHEIVEGRGHPLSDDVDIMLLSLNNDTIPIHFVYWELANRGKSSSLQTHLYTWRWDNDTSDDCSCQTQQIHCTVQTDTNETVVVADHLCDSKRKPSLTKCRSNFCSNQSSSAPRWYPGPWRSCQGPCWPQEAFQRRSLLCVRTLPDNRTHTIPTSICLHWFSSIPMTIRQCPESQSTNIPKCSSLKTFSWWNTSEWQGVRSIDG